MGKFWAYRLRNNRKRTRKDAKPGPGFVTRRNGIGFSARERRELENRRAQALGGSSPSPSVSTDRQPIPLPRRGLPRPFATAPARRGGAAKPLRARPCPASLAVLHIVVHASETPTMPTSVRLDKQAQARLERLARITGRSKSELMREAIARLDETLNGETGPTLYEQLRECIGVVNLGPGDRGRRGGQLPRAGPGRPRTP